MDILDKAIVFAVEAHSGEPRKGTKKPYITHPLEGDGDSGDDDG